LITISLLSSIILQRNQKVSPAIELERILESCRSDNYSLYVLCFKKEAGSLVRNIGANAVINSLDTLFEKQKQERVINSVSCHDVAHIVGELGVAKTENVGEVLAQCTKACGYGCHHGALLSGVRHNPEVLNNLSHICTSVSRPPFQKQDYDACLHGLGHAVSDIANLDITNALSYCDRLSEEREKKLCAEGVFMEIVDSPSFEHPRYAINDDVGVFCDTFAGVFRDVCFETAALHVLDVQSDVSSLKAICKDVPAPQRGPCMVQLLNSLYFIYKGDSDRIISYCSDLQGDLFSACVLGAIQSDIVTNPMPVMSLKVCQNIPADYQHMCYSQLGEKVAYVYGDTAREYVCRGLAEEQMRQCMGL
jgi:hypothetical protein